MLITIIREYKWPPDIIGGLFVDDEDYRGVVYLYNDIVKTSKELKAKK